MINMNCPLIPMLAITGKPDREWIHNRLLGLRQGPSYGSAVAGLSVGQGCDFFRKLFELHFNPNTKWS